jgi:Ca2+-binding EF-hand superfamily protein
MGNAHAGKGEALTPEQVQQRYQVTSEQIDALRMAFAAEAKKGLVDQKTFCAVIERLRAAHPELVPFDSETAPTVFALSDVDHKGKLDPTEVLAALSIFRGGSAREKALLVFRVIDKDGSNTLTRQEVKRHTERVLKLAQQVVTDEMRAKTKEADMAALGKLAAWSMSKAMNALEKKFAEDIVKDIFSHDTDHDGLISEAEWLAAADTNTIKCLVDPQLCSSAWKTVFNDDTGGANETLLQVSFAFCVYCLILKLWSNPAMPDGPSRLLSHL